MLKKDIYTMLSIEKTATDKEVKKAYRQRTLKLHPDKNPNDKNAAAKFDELQQIYDWIMEPQNRAKFDMHLENRQKVEVRRKAMDSALQKRRDDLERREKEAQSGEMASEAKKLSRKEQILRLRAEGVNLLEEEQAKWRLNKKERSECCRLKLKWDHTKKTYASSQLRDALGATAVVLSNKRKGCAVAEFESPKMALGAEITAKRMYQAPIQVQWLTDNRPANADKAGDTKSTSQFTKSQNVAFEAFQAEVLRRCEAA